MATIIKYYDKKFQFAILSSIMILYSYNKRKWVTLEALQIQVTNSFSHSEVKHMVYTK